MKKLKILLPVILFFNLNMTQFCIAAGFSDSDDGYYDDEYYYDEVEEYAGDDYYQEEEKFSAPQKSERGETYYQQRELDPKFKDNYKGKRFQYETEKKEVEPRKMNLPSIKMPLVLGKILMYVIIALIVFIIVYQIIKNSGGFSFGKSKRKINFDTSAEQFFEDKENIENNDFESLISKSKLNNDYRRAVRYYFLWVLQVLTNKKLIKWNKDKTNFEYYSELTKNPIQDDFFKNIHIYDYIWYGNFEINQDDFNKAERFFLKTLNKLK